MASPEDIDVSDILAQFSPQQQVSSPSPVTAAPVADGDINVSDILAKFQPVAQSLQSAEGDVDVSDILTRFQSQAQPAQKDPATDDISDILNKFVPQVEQPSEQAQALKRRITPSTGPTVDLTKGTRKFIETETERQIAAAPLGQTTEIRLDDKVVGTITKPESQAGKGLTAIQRQEEKVRRLRDDFIKSQDAPFQEEKFLNLLERKFKKARRKLDQMRNEEQKALLDRTDEANKKIVAQASRGLARGASLGLSELALSEELRTDLEAVNGYERVITGLSDAIGSTISALGVAGGLRALAGKAGLGKVATFLLVRAGTPLLSSGTRNLVSYGQGDISAGEAAGNVATSLVTSMISAIPEQTIAPGWKNFVGQVMTDAVADVIVDLGVRDRLKDQSFADWLLYEELPNIALSIGMAGDDNFTKQGQIDLRAQQKITKDAAQRLKTKIKNLTDADLKRASRRKANIATMEEAIAKKNQAEAGVTEGVPDAVAEPDAELARRAGLSEEDVARLAETREETQARLDQRPTEITDEIRRAAEAADADPAEIAGDQRFAEERARIARLQQRVDNQRIKEESGAREEAFKARGATQSEAARKAAAFDEQPAAVRQSIEDDIDADTPGRVPDEIQTVTRTAEDGSEQFTAEAFNARRSGTATKKSRSISDTQDMFENTSDIELTKVLNDATDENRFLAGLELIGRTADPDQRQAIYDQMIKSASDFGYMLRTVGELKTSTSEGVLDVVERQLNKQGLVLPPKTKSEIKDLADQNIKAKQAVKDGETAVRENPTDASKLAELEELRKIADQKSNAMMKKIAAASPRNIADTLFTLIQGRLLTPLSQVRNVAMNILAMPTRGMNQTVAALLDGISATARNRPRQIAFPWEGSVAWWKAFGKSVKSIPGILRTGDVPGMSQIAGEVSRSLHPVDALVQAFTGRGLAIDPNTGKPRKIDQVQRAIEATGIDAELMFRLLGVGDALFKQPSQAKALAQIGKLEGLSGKELDAFVAVPTKQAAARAEETGRETVFTQENVATRAVDSFFRTISRTIPGGDKLLRSLTGTIYTKVPINLAIEGLKYTMPELSVAEALVRLKQSRAKNKSQSERAKASRQAKMAFGRAFTGVAMNALAQFLLSEGLISGEPDKDPRLRSAQFSGFKPNSLNMSGLRRLIDGGNPEWQPGDELIQYPYLGFLGMVMQVNANAEQDAARDARREDIAFDPQDMGFFNKQGRRWASTGTATMQMANMKGVQGSLDALAKGEYDRWLQSYTEQASSIVLPNTIKALNRATRESLIEKKALEVRDTLIRVIKDKSPDFLVDISEDPKIRDMWGVAAPTTPIGKDPILHHFFDFTKAETSPSNKETAVAWDAFTRTQDVLAFPSKPKRTLNVNKMRKVLNDKQYDEYIALAGRLRRMAVLRRTRNAKEWDKLSGEKKVDVLKKLYSSGLKKAKAIFLRRHPELRRP